jgi:hypothetical protein
MKISTYLAIAGAVLALFGLQCMLVPQFALQQYGFPTEPHNVLQIRTLGVTQLSYGLTLWLARGTRDDKVLRAILLASVVGNILGLILFAWACLAGLLNAMGWGIAALYAAFVLAALYYLGSPARRA